MLNVIKKKAEENTVLFDDLKVGDIYRDDDGLICIKISDKNSVEFNSLTYEWSEEGCWEPTFESFGARVTPIEADLVIK